MSATEGSKEQKDLLGGKGANLAEMCRLGLPVPPGLTITTAACTYYYTHGRALPCELEDQLYDGLLRMETSLSCRFGNEQNPLLLSVRSGSRSSMPGMMDTILNLGLNDKTTCGLAVRTSNHAFALDSYRRFIQMFAGVVMKVGHHLFEGVITRIKERHGYISDSEFTVTDLQEIISQYKRIIREETGSLFPQDVHEQLIMAIKAVFNSWMNPRAITYREMYHIPAEWGTAVNIQAMVFGNKGNTSGTGVLFTRDPSHGISYLYGEYLLNAQGEDVVAGIRTPHQISEAGRQKHAPATVSLEEYMPAIYKELQACSRLLEQHYKDMQDIEFTIEEEKLWILQTRNGKRSAEAAIRIAVNLVKENILSREEAVCRLSPEDISQLLHPALDRSGPLPVLTKGLPASPGAASGRIVFDAATANQQVAQGETVILVRQETSPEDIAGMKVSKGILTARGGMTSHAAVVARGLGKPCVTGAGSVLIDTGNRTVKMNGQVFNEGDMITIDGTTGEVMAGTVPTREAAMFPELSTFLSWCDGFRKVKIRANADTPADCQVARNFGAEGVGLCRTEHMFFDEERILVFRQMIFAAGETERKAILEKLIYYQREDFKGIFTAMDGFPVTIRLLDPPLHEFLPHTTDGIGQLAEACGMTTEQIVQKANALKEANPMLGHRGCRLAITYPEIYSMQVRAILEAAAAVQQKGIRVYPEIMLPLVIHPSELSILCEQVRQTAAQTGAIYKTTVEYQIGTMIEVPRAAIVADEMAGQVSFFSFGTNDLTQTTLGISRDDSSSFMPAYIEQGIFGSDPFAELDIAGVGGLIKSCLEKTRAVNPSLKIGVCGEHGGNPASIHFFHQQGFDYVSCSPYRIPVARVAAAQQALNGNINGNSRD